MQTISIADLAGQQLLWAAAEAARVPVIRKPPTEEHPFGRLLLESGVEWRPDLISSQLNQVLAFADTASVMRAPSSNHWIAAGQAVGAGSVRGATRAQALLRYVVQYRLGPEVDVPEMPSLQVAPRVGQAPSMTFESALAQVAGLHQQQAQELAQLKALLPRALSAYERLGGDLQADWYQSAKKLGAPG